LWVGVAVAGRVAFPITLEQNWLAPFGGSLIMGLSLLVFRTRMSPSRLYWPLLLAAGGGMLGAFCVFAQRPPAPAAKPLVSNDVPLVKESENRLGIGTMALPNGTVLDASGISVRFEPLTIFVNPVLRFLSQSPDGCWTVFVPRETREGSEPRWLSSRAIDELGNAWSGLIPGQGPMRLEVVHRPARRETRIDAMSRLEQPIHSHLNSYCDFEVRGHRRLFLSFSPCPGAKIEVRKFDYPIGRPSRFAYVDRDRNFRVVEASSGEKGPFRTLAEGRLEAADPLVIMLHDEDRAVARMTLHDWSAQAGTELSPTAGWGVPVNAIEFSLNGVDPSSPASIFVTLAGTSVGRGWNCVTHPAGTYRNRIAVEPWTER
jgi:hypothetical protein